MKKGATGTQLAEQRRLRVGGKRLENEYLASRAKDAAERPKTVDVNDGMWRQANRDANRKNSDVSAELVGHLRWLHEVARLTKAQAARMLNMPYARAYQLLTYQSWCEVEPNRSATLPGADESIPEGGCDVL